MSPTHDATFFLYGIGMKPDVLCLGNLVLGDYGNPSIARHYTHHELKGHALQEHATTSKLNKCLFQAKSSTSPSLKIETADLAELDFSHHTSNSQLVVANSGVRQELKDPEAFLNNEVLCNEKAKTALKLWLSASNSRIIASMKAFRRPKVWMLTGLYMLNNAKTFTLSDRGSELAGGAGSSTIAALTSIPLGGKVAFKSGAFLKVNMVMEGWHVWAAQYRHLGTKYIRQTIDKHAELPAFIPLYPDIVSAGSLRNDEETANMVQVWLEPCEKTEHVSVGRSSELSQQSQEELDVGVALEAAIEDLEDYLAPDDNDDVGSE